MDNFGAVFMRPVKLFNGQLKVPSKESYGTFPVLFTYSQVSIYRVATFATLKTLGNHKLIAITLSITSLFSFGYVSQ